MGSICDPAVLWSFADFAGHNRSLYLGQVANLPHSQPVRHRDLRADCGFRGRLAFPDNGSGALTHLPWRTGRCIICLRYSMAASYARVSTVFGCTSFGHLLASCCDGGVGGSACYRHQPAARRSIGWWTHRLRTVRQRGPRALLLGCHPQHCGWWAFLLALVGLVCRYVLLPRSPADYFFATSRNVAAGYCPPWTRLVCSVVFS